MICERCRKTFFCKLHIGEVCDTSCLSLCKKCMEDDLKDTTRHFAHCELCSSLRKECLETCLISSSIKEVNIRKVTVTL